MRYQKDGARRSSKDYPELTEAEYGVSEIEDIGNAAGCLASLCGSLWKRIDTGTLEERQKTIDLYNRATKQLQSLTRLREEVRKYCKNNGMVAS